MSRTQTLTNKKQIILKPQENEMSDSETEYCKMSEACRLIDKSYQIIMDREDKLIEATKKNIVSDKIIKEAAEQIKNKDLQLKLVQQELDHFKNKIGNKNSNTKLTEHKITKIFMRNDNYIKEECNKGLDNMYEEMKKQYGL